MSFQDKGFWMAKGSDQLSDGETVYTNSSRIESKRPYQWLDNTAEPEAFSNKKPAVQVPVSKPTSGIPTAIVSWENCPDFHSAPNQSLDRLFSSDSARSVNFSENISAHGLENSNMGKKATHEQFGNALSAGLPGSYPLEDTESCVSYGGIRKVKVNQVKDSQNGSHASNENNFGMTLEQTYSSETNTIPRIEIEIRERKRNNLLRLLFQENMGANISAESDAIISNNNSAPAKKTQIITFHSSAKWKIHFEAAKQTDKLMIIDFTATWCGPCRFMEPAITEFAAKYTDVEFIKIDVDELEEVAKEFGVQAMPTFLLIKKGKEVDKVVGARKDDLQKKIEKYRAIS